MKQAINKVSENAYHFSKAVAIVMFNKLEQTKKVLEAVRMVTPPRLYLISDGPRPDKQGEAERVMEVRTMAEGMVDWNCEVIKVYSKQNMGCDVRSVTGYNYVFEHEEEAVLLEDDSVPAPFFFPFCERMLNQYANDEKVMMVTAFNINATYQEEDKDYYFSYYPMKCAWATWKRAWKKFDFDMKDYPHFKNGHLKEILPPKVADTYKQRLLSAYNGWRTWDLIWDYARFNNDGLGIVPKYNMAINIGFGIPEATHTSGESYLSNMEMREIEELRFREHVEWDRAYDYAAEEKSEFQGGNRRLYRQGKVIYYAKKVLSPKIYRKLVNRFK